jgi:formylglycine-generating enzyme required for sulfatase activity
MISSAQPIQDQKLPETIVIPAGEFQMGSRAGAACERPVHRVWVDAFGIGKFAVTNRLYRLFVEQANYPSPAGWADPRFSQPDQPVTSVSWYDAVAYCDWLTLSTGTEFRLPTEAEWERAARGVMQGSLYTWGDSPPQEQPRYHELWRSAPERVGQRPPAGFGLYDISENVHEWCQDWFQADYYERSPLKNPQGPQSGTRKASRGGSWRHEIKIARVAARSSIPPQYRYSDYGFRVAVTITPASRASNGESRDIWTGQSDGLDAPSDLEAQQSLLQTPTVGGSAIAGLTPLGYNKLPPGGRRKGEARQL